MTRWRSMVAAAVVGLLACAGAAHAQTPGPRRAEIREQTMGLLAARLKAEVGLSDGQVERVLPRIESIEESRRHARRERLRLLASLRRDVNRGAPDADLQRSLEALDRIEKTQEQAARETLSTIDADLTVPQRVRLRFVLARFRGELTRQVEAIREGRRGPR